MLTVVAMYTITSETVLIKRYYHPHLQSEIHESNGACYFSAANPLTIIEQNCKNHGASLQGRLDALRDAIGEVKYMKPAIISEGKRLIMHPNRSRNHEDCVWFNPIYLALHGHTYRHVGRELTLDLPNRSTISFPISENLLTGSLASSFKIFLNLFYNQPMMDNA